MGVSYILGVKHRQVHPVGPVDQTLGLRAILEVMFVDTLVNLLDIVAIEIIRRVSPVAVLNIVDLGRDRSDNAKVVARAANGPPKIRAAVNGAKLAICRNYVGRHPLV